MAAMWLRLLQLPMKLWGPATLWSIVNLAGMLVVVDDCTAEQRCFGFAPINVQIDLSRSLRPKVLIKGPKGNCWQRFVCMNLRGVCFQSWHFHSSGERCVEGGDGGRSPTGLQLENAIGAIEEEVTGDTLRPWLVAVWQWLPRLKASSRTGRMRAKLESLGFISRNSSKEPSRIGKDQVDPVLESGYWIKLAKIA